MSIPKETLPREQPDFSASNGSAIMRYEMAAMAIAHERLRRFPDQQAEAIGKHYVAHATLALNLLELIRARRYGDDSTNIDAAIDQCVDQIKRNHRHDFGIELEWPNERSETPPTET